MEAVHYDAFISYRRENGFLLAQVILFLLRERGIHCFLDLENDRSGNFNENLISAIDASTNFILILPPNALDRCVNDDDWVRREIVEAVTRGKHIIPVRYDDFTWPKSAEWMSAVPPELRSLSQQQDILVTQEYLHSAIDRLVRYMEGVRPVVNALKGSRIPGKGPEFVRFCMEHGNVQSIDMAFHAGSNWHRDDHQVDLLDEMIARGIPVRVLVNDSKTVSRICAHLRRPRKKYVKFSDAIQEWVSLQTNHPEVFQIRVCKLPLLHRMYVVHRKDGFGYANIHYYTYGPYNPAKDSWSIYDSTAPEFRLYSDEFDYLWEMSELPAQ